MKSCSELAKLLLLALHIKQTKFAFIILVLNLVLTVPLTCRQESKRNWVDKEKCQVLFTQSNNSSRFPKEVQSHRFHLSPRGTLITLIPRTSGTYPVDRPGVRSEWSAHREHCRPVELRCHAAGDLQQWRCAHEWLHIPGGEAYHHKPAQHRPVLLSLI